jgi:cation diffusion facilitator CzcD-associated flavoprotein CzcO/predicted ATP-grasp superfamily ATP-dependent carboligase
MSRPRVLITDGEMRSVLAVARGLADDGFDVSAAATAGTRPAAAHLSRAVSERVILPDPLTAQAEFLDELERTVSRGGFSALIAGADASLLRISSGRARLEPHVRLGLPAHEQVMRSLDKAELVATAKRHGLDPPLTIACGNVEDAVAAAEDLGFPVLVKPLRTINDELTPSQRLSTAWVEDAQGLSRQITQFGGAGLIQRRVHGAVVSFAGVFAGGRLLAEAFSRYARTWPANAGNASFSQTLEAPVSLRRQVVALLDDLGWEGIFELELMETTPSTWNAIDMNPRPYGSMAVAIAAGANLPSVWSRHLLDDDPGPVKASPGVLYRWTDADLCHGLWQLRTGGPAAAVAVLRPRRGVVHPYAHRSDPGPGAARLVELGGMAVSRYRGRQRSGTSGLPTAVVGAGPNGLAIVAHLRDAGIRVACFGQPLESWSQHMPAGMLLRSRRRSTHIADPHQALTIDAYERAHGTPVSTPTMTLEEFVDYGRWFQRTAVPDVDTRKVTEVTRRGEAFRVTLDDGDEVVASRVIVAAGLSPFMHCPEPFAALPATMVSHSYEHSNLATFAGLCVAVIGSGQSALESAALLHEAGATVEVLARASSIRWLGEDDNGATRPPLGRRLRAAIAPPTDVGGAAHGWIAAVPDAFRRTPESLHPTISFRCIRPAGAGWLRSRLADVPISLGRQAIEAHVRDGAVELHLDDGSSRVVDRVLLGTGFRVDVRRYPFLADELLASLELADGYPVLRAGLESSVTGLHFAGAPAAYSFGPVMRFVVGSWYAAPAIARRAADRLQPPISFAFPRPRSGRPA